MAILGEAKLNTMRVNAARLDFYRPFVYVTLNGTRCETQIRKKTVRLRKYNASNADSQGQINKADFTMDPGSVTPAKYMDLKVYLGSLAPQSLEFGGTVQLVEVATDENRPVATFKYNVSAVGYPWRFNSRYVNKAYVGLSATAVIADIVATCAPSFTINHVQRNLPAISINFSFVLPLDALAQIAALVGTIAGTSARFFLDDTGDLWFTTKDARVPPETVTGLSATNPIANALALSVKDDGSQVRTSVYVKGGAQTTSAAAIQGGPATVLPVANAQPFDLSGTALASAQVAVQTPLSGLPASATEITRTDILTYTGTSRSGIVQAPSSVAGITVTPLNIGATGHLTNGAAYQWGFTYVTALGETAISPLVAAVITGVSGANAASLALPSTGALYVTGVNGVAPFPPDRSITAINLYRTEANGTQLFLCQTVTIGASQWPVSISDVLADNGLGGPPPLVPFVPQGQTLATSGVSGAAIGSTSIPGVPDVSGFDAGGGYIAIGDLVVGYTGIAFTNAGNFKIGTVFLAAPLPSTVPGGVTMTVTPALTGVTGIIPWAPTQLVSVGGGFQSGSPITLGTIYGWAATFVTAAGESTPGPLSFPNVAGITPTGVAAANGGAGSGPTNGGVYSYIVASVTLAGVLSVLSTASANITSNGTGITVSANFGSAGGTAVTTSQVFVFRTKAGGSTYFVCNMVSPNFSGGIYTAVDDNPDSNLIIAMTTDWTQNYTVSPLPIGPAGVTARKLYRNTGPGTALKLVVTIGDNTTVSYTDAVADGSLGAAAPTIDTAGVIGLPPIAPNQTVTAFTQLRSAAAIAALAAAGFNDGIVDHFVADASLLTAAGAAAEAAGQITIYSNGNQQLMLRSRDAKLVPGVTVVINVPSDPRNGSYLVQDTQITDIEPKIDGVPYAYPIREVHGSTIKWTLEDFLWNVKLSLDQLK